MHIYIPFSMCMPLINFFFELWVLIAISKMNIALALYSLTGKSHKKYKTLWKWKVIINFSKADFTCIHFLMYFAHEHQNCISK